LSSRIHCSVLSCELGRLTQNLLSSGRYNLIRLPGESKDSSDDDNDLILRKGVYSYDCMDNASKFDESVLPPREAFFSRLTQEECAEENYKHAQRVCDAVGCQPLKDCHDLYLKCDALLLADIFETFRTTAMSEYRLDPAHYVSAPHLSWDAVLRSTLECYALAMLRSSSIYSRTMQCSL
jgi:hypothetical protein